MAELEQIGRLMVSGLGYALSEPAEEVFREYLERRSRQPRFANARSVRNAVERARLRHANRLLAGGGQVDRADLTTLRPRTSSPAASSPAATPPALDRMFEGARGSMAARGSARVITSVPGMAPGIS